MTNKINNIQDEAMEDFKNFVRDHIKKNKDKTLKSVGDRVLFWDISRLTDVKTNQVNRDLLDHQILVNYPSIIIEDNVRYNQPVIMGNRQYDCNLDLIVWNKTLNMTFRTSSEFVRITDKNP